MHTVWQQRGRRTRQRSQPTGASGRIRAAAGPAARGRQRGPARPGTAASTLDCRKPRTPRLRSRSAVARRGASRRGRRRRPGNRRAAPRTRRRPRPASRDPRGQSRRRTPAGWPPGRSAPRPRPRRHARRPAARTEPRPESGPATPAAAAARRRAAGALAQASTSESVIGARSRGGDGNHSNVAERALDPLRGQIGERTGDRRRTRPDPSGASDRHGARRDRSARPS